MNKVIKVTNFGSEFYYIKYKIMNINVDLLKDIAIEAGNEILKIYNDESLSKEVELKSDNSPLTLADKASNAVIVKALAEHFPEIPILSEESASGVKTITNVTRQLIGMGYSRANEREADRAGIRARRPRLAHLVGEGSRDVRRPPPSEGRPRG